MGAPSAKDDVLLSEGARRPGRASAGAVGLEKPDIRRQQRRGQRAGGEPLQVVAPKRRERSAQASSEPRHLEEEIVTFAGSERSPWFTSLVQALDGVDHLNAARRPAEGLNSIWAVVNHVSFWHELALRWLRGGPTTDEAAIESGWSLAASGTADDWAGVRQELISRNAAFARAVGTLSPSELQEPWAPGRAPRWQLAYGLMNHTSHHTADVLIARRLLGIPLAS